MARGLQLGPCSAPGCGRPIKSKYWCGNHYARQWKHGRLHKVNTGDKAEHPLYHLWQPRRKAGELVPEWNDFWAFVRCVEPKPASHVYLARVKDGPLGPDNWAWLPQLRRQPGETKSEFNARKWQSRRQRFPDFESNRYLRRRYGITLAEYDARFVAQGGACAICRKPETALNPRTELPARLAVDHCHESGVVRDLLCFRCNVLIGKAEDSPPLLRAMADYLETHARRIENAEPSA